MNIPSNYITSLIAIVFLFATFWHCSNCIAIETRRPVAVVCPTEFRAVMEEWAEHRSSQGYSIHWIDPQRSVKFSVNTIKDDIRHLIGRLSSDVSVPDVPLEAILLVGSGIDRCRSDNGSGMEPDNRGFVPSPRLDCRIIQRFGEEKHLASDDWFADFNDDGLADCPVGRFPVETSSELRDLVRKTLDYERKSRPGLWSRQWRIVAGIGNFSPLIDGAIESTAKYALTESVPLSWELSFLHANWKSPFCPSVYDYETALVRSLDRDSLFWIYLGHGRHRMLQPLETPRGFVPSLHADEFPELYRAADNPRRPIALLFCCYGGTLDAPTRGLAEELLLRSEGPVAVLAASRTTMPYGMGVYGVELLQELSRQQNTAEPLTLGRLSFAAKHNMLRPQSNSHAEAVNHANASHTIAMKTTRQRVRHRPLRENLETLARMFDPTALQLSVQLEEHAALFHLFGDPLLRLPKPKPIWLECPEKAKPGETLFISGQIGRTDHRDSVDETAFRGNVLVEWVLAPQRISLSSARRSEIRLDEETRRRDNAEYSAANNRVLFRTNAVVETGRFNATLTVPTDARGRYVVRVFALNETENDYALGAASVDIGRGN